MDNKTIFRFVYHLVKKSEWYFNKIQISNLEKNIQAIEQKNNTVILFRIKRIQRNIFNIIYDLNKINDIEKTKYK